MDTNSILVVWAVLVSLTIMAGVVVAILAFIQVRKAARQAEILFQSINKEMQAIERVTDTVSTFLGRFTSPWVRAGSIATGIIASLLKKSR